MLLSIALPLASAVPAPAPAGDSLLATVPHDAYTLVHCLDVAVLRERAERNDWYRLLGSPDGEPILSGLAHEVRAGTHSDLDPLLEMAAALEGETVFFDTGSVAGFVTEPPGDREALADLVREWMPRGDAAARRRLELAGGMVELVAWPDELDGWTGRAGHFAAFVDHPRALAIYSGDDSESVITAVTEGFTALGAERRSPLVESYLASGGGRSGGIELFIDFTPLLGEAEAALAQAADGMLPDPSSFLGLESGTWMHATADVYPGTRIECRAQLSLPPDTLAARLADTFKPLPHTLPADLPKGIWGMWTLNWDLRLFYQRARAAYEESGQGKGLTLVDAGIAAAQGAAGVDPVEDVLNQFAGVFTAYFVDRPDRKPGDGPTEVDEIASLGVYAQLVDGEAFLTAFEKLIGVGGLEGAFDEEVIAGVDAYVGKDEGFDGGIAFLPQALAVAPTRHVLERGLLALTRAEDANLLDGSRMQAAIDESAGACFFAGVEMTPLRAVMLPELEADLHLPPLEEGEPNRDPFDSQLISTVERTRDGFELRIRTR